MFGPDHRALANAAVKVTLIDDQGQTQFEDTANTSKFGVAKADWEIPQKLQLGDILITSEVQGDPVPRARCLGRNPALAAMNCPLLR